MTEVVVYLALFTIALVVVGFMLGTVASEIRWHRATRRARRRRARVEATRCFADWYVDTHKEPR